MTVAEIKALLETSGLNFAYHHWINPPALPYGLFMVKSSDNINADGCAYYKQNNVTAELYSEIKSPAVENALESVLDGAGVFYEKSETYIESEAMYQITYEMRL